MRVARVLFDDSCKIAIQIRGVWDFSACAWVAKRLAAFEAQSCCVNPKTESTVTVLASCNAVFFPFGTLDNLPDQLSLLSH